MHLVRCFIGETTSNSDPSHSYVTMVFMQCGGLLAVRNRRVSIL